MRDTIADLLGIDPDCHPEQPTTKHTSQMEIITTLASFELQSDPRFTRQAPARVKPNTVYPDTVSVFFLRLSEAS